MPSIAGVVQRLEQSIHNAQTEVRLFPPAQKHELGFTGGEQPEKQGVDFGSRKGHEAIFFYCPHFYKHWENNTEGLIEIDYELGKLAEKLSAIESYLIFAKSAGILLTLQGIKKRILHPDKCVFVGTPIVWAKENNFDFDNLIQDLALPTLFIQHSNNPVIVALNLT